MDAQIDRVLNGKKTKFSLLKTLLSPLNLHRKNSVRVFLDVDSFLSSIFSSELGSELIAEKDNLYILSQITSIAGHYKYFFTSRMGMDVDIILFSEIQKNLSLLSAVPNYRKEHYETESILPKELAEYKSKNSKLAKKVVDFIPYIYYVNNTDKIVYDDIPYIISNEMEAIDAGTSQDIVISNRPTHLLYVAYGMAHLSMKGHNSVLTTKENFITSFEKLNKYKVIHTDYSFPVELFKFIFILSGTKSYNLSPYKVRFGYSKSLKVINTLFSDGKITKNSTTTDIISSMGITDEGELSNIYSNATALDVETRYSELLQSEKVDLLLQMKDMTDWEGLAKFNETRMTNYPIRFEFLT